MSLRSHLLLSPEPLTFAGFAICLCGASVRNPEPVMMVNLAERLMPDFDSLRDCSKCIHAAEHTGGLRYLYAVIPGQLAREWVEREAIA